jgi:hypothetical protein
MWQTLETKAKFIAQVMSGDMTIRRLEDLDSAALTYAEVKAIASGNPLVIEKAQVDAELIRLTRLRSAHAEEQYRIRQSPPLARGCRNLYHGTPCQSAAGLGCSAGHVGRQIPHRTRRTGIQQPGHRRGIDYAPGGKIKARFGEDIRIGRFAGFDLFMRPVSTTPPKWFARQKQLRRAGHGHGARHHPFAGIDGAGI